MIFVICQDELYPDMIRVFDDTSRCSRREWLRFGSLALAGSGLGAAVNAGDEAGGAPGFGKAKSVILIYASGGQSQIDMWDPKPNAPLDVRGAFGTTATAVTGQHFCEHMPRIARIADRFTVIRSMSHRDLDHGSATYLSLTGRYHTRLSSNPPPKPTDYPTYGAILRRLNRPRQFVHDAIHVNGPALVPFEPSPGQNGGFLGRRFEPMLVGDVSRDQYALPGLDPLSELPPVRLRNRLQLKQALDAHAAKLDSFAQARDLNGLYHQAAEVLTSPTSRQAFDLSQESEATRNRYGRHRSGQGCLLARRLVEAGVPFVNVIWNHSNRGQDRYPDKTDEYGWDTHNDIFDSLRTHLLPRFDVSFSALIEDLDRRGLLASTLVVCMGEFGRAPRVALEPNFKGAAPGRKHWASVYSIVMAGAGVARGGVVGASDRLGGEPLTASYGPWDVAATMFAALGIPPNGHYTDSLNRPIPISIGKPISAAYA